MYDILKKILSPYSVNKSVFVEYQQHLKNLSIYFYFIDSTALFLLIAHACFIIISLLTN